ncbi:acyltransferase-domain-containing protein [Dentipellis sp. KUC8613]|nr:acyltransferase-domain-containing protein [Dentipellis sp. KUC8613]
MSVLSYLVKPLAYLGLPVFLLHTLSSSSPVARYYVRITLYLSTLGLCSAWGVVVSVAMSLAGRRFDINWVIARSFYAIASRVMDIKMTVEGAEYLETRPAVLIGNHQSMLDILYLGRIFPKRASIMAKRELQWMPLLGQFLTFSGAVFVDRGNNAKAVRSLAAAGETMRNRKTSLWLFPEGTRSQREYHDMLPFKKGAFHLAVQAGVPIVPVICENYWRMYRQNVFTTGNLKIKVLPPIPTEGLTTADIPDLVVRIHAQMVAALREISDPSAPPAPSAAGASAGKREETPAATSSHQGEPSAVASAPAAEVKKAESVPSTTSTDPSPPSSLADSESESGVRRREGSENGVETEEDEGMVLVGRPQ